MNGSATPSPKAAPSPKALLRGIQVVERASDAAPDLVRIAAAFTGRLLADLGAAVTRVESPDDGLARLRSVAHEDLSAGSVLSTFLNRGKARTDEGGAAAALAAAQLAVVAEPDPAEGLVRPDGGLSVVRLSGARPGAGLDDAPLSELGIQGLVGLTDLFGEPDGQPLAMGGHQTAYATGYAAFCAAMALIAKQRLCGQADCAEVNAVDALAWVNWKGIAAGTLGFPVRREGRAADAPVLRCADGHFAFLYLPRDWDHIRAAVDDPRLESDRFASPGRRARNAGALNEILGEWASTQTREALYDFCQRCGIPGGPVLHAADLLGDAAYSFRGYLESTPHGADRSVTVPGLPMTIEDAATPPNRARPAVAGPSAPEAGDAPLAGMTVLDLGIFTAGSVTSTLLADLGATVIKVESETYSDPFRIWPGIDGDSPLFTFNNRNKLGVNIDLKTDAGRERFLKLVAKADVVVENFRRGVMDRLGIGYSALKAANPRIVLASISGQGASGPGSTHVSFGSTLEAIGGVAALTGYAGGSCYISGRNLNYPDQIVCLYGAGAAIAALLTARERGAGMHIDVSQREVTSLAVGEQIAAASLATGTAAGTATGFPGNASPNAALQDIFPVEDGWLCVTVPDAQRQARLAQVLGSATEDLRGALGSWLAERTAAAASEALRPLGIAANKANTGAEAAADPSIRDSAAFARTPAGAMVKGFPFRLLNTPLHIRGESPKMGEHTDQVLSEFLGAAG